MADQLQLRGGTTNEHSTFTGALREVTVDTDKDTLIVHDAATAGGHPLLREDGSNSALSLGTAGTPSLKFTGDANTGIYSPGADQVAISTAGTGNLFVHANGNVSIGANSAAGKLALTGSNAFVFGNQATTGTTGTGRVLATGGEVYIQAGLAATSGSNAPLVVTGYGGIGERLRITSDGKVGVGTSSPADILTVDRESTNTNVATAGGIFLSNTNTAANNVVALTFTSDPTNAAHPAAKIGAIFTDRTASSDDTDLYLGTVNAGSFKEAIRIKNSGNVGIGTTSPDTPLHVDIGTLDQAAHFESTDSIVRIKLKDGTTTNAVFVAGKGDNLAFETAGTNERARIDSSGRLLVGTTSTSAACTAILQNRSDNGGPGTLFLSTNSTAPTTGEAFGRIVWTDSGHSPAVWIEGGRDGGTWTSGSSQPSKLVFSTTADGASSPTERMRIDSSGRVGIGTTDPSANSASGAQNLVIGDATASVAGMTINTGTGVFQGRINFGRGTTTQSYGYILCDHSQAFLGFGLAGSERARIDSSGRLGIGTTSPQQRLHIRGASANAGIRLESDGGSGETYEIRSLTNGVLTVGTTLANVLNVTPSSVGIGTTSPDQILTIRQDNAGGEGASIRLHNSSATAGSNNKLIFTSSTNATFQSAAIIATRTASGTTIAFESDGTNERLRIDESGRLLVGTSSNNNVGGHNAKLQVEDTGYGATIQAVRNVNGVDGAYLFLAKSRGTTAGSTTIVQDGDELGNVRFLGADGSTMRGAAEITCEVDGTPGATDMPGRLVFSTTADGSIVPTERMRIRQDGQTVISRDIAGTITASATTSPLLLGASSASTNPGLEVTTANTATRYHASFSNPNGIVGTITTNGSATAYNTSSDYRLKENIVSLTGAADRVNQLQVRRFNFIADPDTTVDGFIAHEAQAVVPEAVTGTHDEVDADGNPVYQGIDQSKLVPLLTAALQEALAKIETLEQRLSDAGIA